MVYAIRTKELHRNLLGKMDTYMYKHIRATMKPNGEQEVRYPAKRTLYRRLKQSPVESWINITQIAETITQTQRGKTIHPLECNETKRTLYKLKDQWKYKRHAVQDQIEDQSIEGAEKEARWIGSMGEGTSENSPKGGNRR